MRKSELRKIYLERQKKLSQFERTQKSRQIADKFFQEFDLNKVHLLHCFISIEKFNEIDSSWIFKQIWQSFPQIQTYVPRINFQTDEIENIKFEAESKLSKNIWQISEPTADEMISPEKIDIILVPLLCFDKKGFRVGYGKGFYDKLLKKCRKDCLKIGLSYFAPVEIIKDVKIFDIKLDFCLTPEKLWKFSAAKISKELSNL